MIEISSKTSFNLKKASKIEKLFLFSLITFYIILTLNNIYFYPLFIDEALTYNKFTSTDFFNILSNYELPNNHILFSLITFLFKNLPFSTIVNLRIPNLFIGISSILLLYILLRNFFNFKSVIIPLSIFTFSYFFTFYSCFARGYLLVIFFFIGGFYSLIKTPKKNIVNWKYIILCSLGFYSIPIFLYCFITLIIFQIVFLKKQYFKSFFINNFFVTIFTFILYLPVILHSGFDKITNNEYVQSKSLTFIFESFNHKHLFSIYDKILGININYLIIVYLIFLFFLFFKNRIQKKIFYFVILSFILPYIFMFTQKVIPGTRTWIYIVFPFTFGLTYIIDFSIEKIKVYQITIISILIILLQVYIFNKSHPLAAQIGDFQTTNFIKKLKKYNFNSFYIDEEPLSYIETYIIFFNKDVKTYNKSNFEKTFDNIDCLILNENSELNSNFKKKVLEFKPYYKIYSKN